LRSGEEPIISKGNLSRLWKFLLGRLSVMRAGERRWTAWLQMVVLVPANLIGAVVSFTYFNFVDPLAPGRDDVLAGSVLFFLFGFALLSGLVSVWANRWSRVLDPVDGRVPTSTESRRRALLLPYALAGIVFIAWTLAGLLFGVIRPLMLGAFTPERAVRFIFGNTFVAGGATTALTFLLAEHLWRRELPKYFPEGDLSAVPGVIRLHVRARLLVILHLVGVLPLLVLGVMAYRRAESLPGLDPTAAAHVMGGLLVAIGFIAVVGIVAAIGLGLVAAASVATPLREIQSAMREVETGNLDAHCRVVSNDEIGAAAEGFNRMVGGLREREFLKETFGKYVSREVRDEILAGRISLEGQVREVTILFADLRDFTPWVESTGPREVVRDLNEYFTEMETAIREHRGLVLQFIGDEIEAAFGAPIANPAHAEMAVRAALDMRRRLAAWNAARARAGKMPLRHGIGIHTGSVLAGNIGSAERHSYALVGDPVNLASRIQSLTKEFGADILVSGDTRRHLDASFDLVQLPAVRVKGKSVEVEVYRLT
jgi:adenylate cyclase